MSALIVHLPSGPVSSTTEYDFALTGNGATVVRHGAAQASVLPPPPGAGAGAEVVAVVPVTMLSWHRVELPKGVSLRSPRLRQVLEGVLEDRLLDEPDRLHFALAPDTRAESATWVVTCDRAWLRSAVQALEAAGRPVSRIVPEFTPQPVPTLHATGEPDRASLILTNADGVASLPLAPAALALLPSLPADTQCIAEPAVASLAEQLLQHPVTLQQPAERWLQASRSTWDLAQFDFSSSGGTRALKRFGTMWADMLAAPQWRPARWAAVALVALNVIGLNVYAWRERSALDGKRAAMTQMLTQTFPRVKVVVDAPAQMEKEVGMLRQATGAASDRDLEAMLAALAGAAGGRTLNGIDYTNGELRAKGLGDDQGRQISGALRSRGYSANPAGGAIVITAGAAP